jgi:hypothetical protein
MSGIYLHQLVSAIFLDLPYVLLLENKSPRTPIVQVRSKVAQQYALKAAACCTEVQYTRKEGFECFGSQPDSFRHQGFTLACTFVRFARLELWETAALKQRR